MLLLNAKSAAAAAAPNVLRGALLTFSKWLVAALIEFVFELLFVVVLLFPVRDNVIGSVVGSWGGSSPLESLLPFAIATDAGFSLFTPLGLEWDIPNAEKAFPVVPLWGDPDVDVEPHYYLDWNDTF